MPGDILADDKYKQIHVFILQNVCCFFFFFSPLGSVMLLENRILVFAIILKVAVIMQMNLAVDFLLISYYETD